MSYASGVLNSTVTSSLWVLEGYYVLLYSI